MGIRFYCPNGHKLNVKANLAGKIGICPKCQARMLIPLESTRQSGAVKPAASGFSSEIVGENDDVPEHDLSIHEPLVSTSPLLNVDDESDDPLLSQVLTSATPDLDLTNATPSNDDETPLPSSPDITLESTNSLLDDAKIVWYLRSSDNQTYGPATGNVIRNWMNEKRIAPDMLIWREGWSNWLEAKNVFPELETIFGEKKRGAALEPPEPVLPPNLVLPNVAAEQSIASLSISTSAESKIARRRQKVSRDFVVIVGLISLVVILLVVLLFVLTGQRQGTPESSSDEPTTEAASESQVFANPATSSFVQNDENVKPTTNNV